MRSIKYIKEFNCLNSDILKASWIMTFELMKLLGSGYYNKPV